MNTPEENRRDCPWNQSDAIIVVLFGLFLISGGLLDRASGASGTATPITFATLIASLFPAILAIVLLFTRSLQAHRSLRSLLGITDPIRELVCGSVLGILVLPVTTTVSFLTGWTITALTDKPPAPQELLQSILMDETPFPLAVAIIIIAITLIPIAEEILYRGILMSVLRRRGTPFAVLASSLFFSALHLSPLHFPALAILGAAFAFTYLRSGSLLMAIAMHATYNAISLLLATCPIFS